MRKIKYMFFSLFCMLVMSSNVLATDEVVKNIQNFEDSFPNLRYSVVKLNDGYLSFYPEEDNSTGNDELWIAKYDENGDYIDEIYPKYEYEYYYMTEHAQSYKISDELVILSTNFVTVTVDTDTLQIIDENVDVACSDMMAYNNNILCVGDMIYFGSHNDLKLIDSELNIIQTKTFEDNEYVLAATVDGEDLYIIVNEASKFYNTGIYTLRKLDKNLNEISRVEIQLGDYYFSTIGGRHLRKIDDDFYYLHKDIFKINPETGAVEFVFENWESTRDYTSIEYINGYIVLGGLNDEDDVLTAIVDIFDTEMNLKQTISINQVLDYANSSNNWGMSVVKSITPTANGFYATGLLEEDGADISFYSEYVFPYEITSKTDGNGTVTHNKMAHQDSIETFTIVPKEGYRIKSITITKKSDGTSVTYTEDELLEEMPTYSSANTFTMPADDVHIVATFEKIETTPDTSDNILTYVIMLLGGILALGTIIYRRNHA